MKLKLRRLYETGIHTVGLLECGRRVFTTLEDAGHDRKIKGQTRIPAGTYDLQLRTTSPMASRYRKRFGEDHEGMIWLQNVPQFDFVYLHLGNVAEDTEGCILVGKTMEPVRGFIGDSVKAYEELYPPIMEALKRNDKVTLRIEDSFG